MQRPRGQQWRRERFRRFRHLADEKQQIALSFELGPPASTADRTVLQGDFRGHTKVTIEKIKEQRKRVFQ